MEGELSGVFIPYEEVSKSAKKKDFNYLMHLIIYDNFNFGSTGIPPLTLKYIGKLSGKDKMTQELRKMAGINITTINGSISSYVSAYISTKAITEAAIKAGITVSNGKIKDSDVPKLLAAIDD